MSKILSQEEVEALLNTVDNSEYSATNPNSNNLSYRIYDFKKKKSTSLFDISIFEFISDRLANYLKTSLSTLIMKNIKAETKSVTTITLKEFKNSLNFPSAIYFFKMKPLEGKSIIAFNDTTVFAFVELFFGGTSISEKSIDERPFTLVEQKIMKKVALELIEPVKKAFLPIYNFEPELLNLEMRPKFINIVSDKERVAIFDISIFIDDFECKLFFAIPYSTLEPIDVKLSQEDGSKDEGESKDIQEKMLNAINDVPLNIVAELAQVSMTFNEIRAMRIGEIIPLSKLVNDELNVYIEGELKLKGIHGIYKGTHAIKITKIL